MVDHRGRHADRRAANRSHMAPASTGATLCRAALERVTLTAYGCCVAVELPDAVVPSLLAALPPGYRLEAHRSLPQKTWRLSPGPDGAMQAFAGEGVLATDHDVSFALDVLMSDLELWVAEHSTEFVFVHAGCVAVSDRAIVIPGRTLTGKSTLVAALTSAGGTYYSDEYALIDTAGCVWPYARPLCIRPPGGGRAHRVSPADLGGAVGETPVRIGVVATLRYSEAGWDALEVGQGEAVLSLIENSVAARRSPEAVLSALVAATEGAAALRGTRGEADVAAGQLLDGVSAL